MAIALSNPAELLVRLDCWVVWIDHDDFVELVLAILANPVGVENFEVRVALVGSLLSHALDGLRHGDFLDTSLRRLALHVDLTLAESSASYARADYGNALLRLVAEAAGCVEASWTIDALEYRLTAPSCHTVTAVCRRNVLLRLLPNRSKVLHDSHI